MRLNRHTTRELGMRREPGTNTNSTTNGRRHYALTLKRYLLVVALLLITQLLFFLCNTRIFHLNGMGELLLIAWGNVRFGLASTALFLLPWLLLTLLPLRARQAKGYRLAAETLFYVGSLLLLLTNLVDAAYYQFTYRRMNAMMFRYMSIGGEMGTLLPKFVVDYWYATLSAVVVTVLLVAGTLHLRMQEPMPPTKPARQGLLGSVASLALVLVLLRGGVGRKWISPDESVRYAQPKNSALVLNSAFNIARTIGHLEPEPVAYMSSARAASLYSPIHQPCPAQPDSATRNQPRKNVVVIMLESFSQEYMGCYNETGESYTPFLDELAKKSRCYQGRSNGKESIESMPAVLASLPSWGLCPFIMSKHYDDTIVALPTLLKSSGYSTAFYHGGYNGTMSFDLFCRKAGIERYHGKDEYVRARGAQDYDGTWGIYDEPFLQYAADEMGKMPSPFFSAVFTLSSHHPYGLPQGYEGRFPKGKHPLLQTVAYTDYALRRFFETAQQQDWYHNTLFVITADHPGQGLGKAYNDYGGWYRIPMMFFDPSDTTRPCMSNDIVQQIDIMPTLLDMLGVDAPAVCFGHSLLRHDSHNKGWHVVFGNGYHQLERQGRIAILSPHKTVGREDDINFLQAVVQTYAQRLLNNQLSPTDPR